jgi:hypothetical protein
VMLSYLVQPGSMEVDMEPADGIGMVPVTVWGVRAGGAWLGSVGCGLSATPDGIGAAVGVRTVVAGACAGGSTAQLASHRLASMSKESV